jgi:hypothetical protein
MSGPAAIAYGLRTGQHPLSPSSSRVRLQAVRTTSEGVGSVQRTVARGDGVASRMGLVRMARLTRRQLIMFALLSAAINGVMTATVGAWLTQTYSSYQSRRHSVQNIADLIYERRARAGMVVSALRRNADLDEVRYRKRAYDEVFVEWNKRIAQNVFQIRELVGEREMSDAEKKFQELIVRPLSHIDTCVTRAYDLRLASQDPLAILDACEFPVMHQMVLDCASTFTDELYKLTRLNFSPFANPMGEFKTKGQERIASACARPEKP